MSTHFWRHRRPDGPLLRHITRSLDTIITTAIMPIALMLLFVFVFGGAINTGADGSYVNYMLPGILLITIASGVSYTAYRLFLDLKGGIFERFRPCRSRAPACSGPTCSPRSRRTWSPWPSSSASRCSWGSAPGPGAQWLAVAGLLVLFTLALTWIAVIAGLSAKTVDGASAFCYPLIFLPFISSAFCPARCRARSAGLPSTSR